MLTSRESLKAVRSGPRGWLDLDNIEQWRNLDHRPFAFRHKLALHPLFTVERLALLSNKVFERADYMRYFGASDKYLPKKQLRQRLQEDISGVATNGRWLALHFIDEMDKAYAELFDQLMADIELMTGVRVRDRMNWGSMSVFLNAPGLEVPYHFDHETSFLMQVQGRKLLRVYPNRREVLSEQEIEDFYRHNPMAGRYRPEFESKAEVFELLPGLGVHHPPLAPHRITNGSEVSISVSIYYAMPQTERTALIHQVNYCLRKMGITPSPPGVSPYWDRVKAAFMRRLSIAHPSTHDEMLYSGIDRLSAPWRLAKRLRSRSAGRH